MRVLSGGALLVACCLLSGGCGSLLKGVANRTAATLPASQQRFYALPREAKQAADVGNFAKAQKSATELLQLAPKFPKDWNYGNAIHDGNVVLGRVALAKGDRKTAIQRLLAAGKTPGSPQLNSFGPNMNLAKELAAKGEKTAVVQYFDECKAFWKMHDGRLDTWRAEVKAGQVPNFGPNLMY